MPVSSSISKAEKKVGSFSKKGRHENRKSSGAFIKIIPSFFYGVKNVISKAVVHSFAPLSFSLMTFGIQIRYKVGQSFHCIKILYILASNI